MPGEERFPIGLVNRKVPGKRLDEEYSQVSRWVYGTK